MTVSTITEADLTEDVMDRLLFRGIRDTGENGDCIIVLGSSKAAEYRVPVAVDAYRGGRAPKIMLCGGKLRDFPDGVYSEAEHMRRAASAAGVADEDLILENSSQSTIENLLFALIELQRNFCLNRVHRILLVTTVYHMRRSLAIARYLFPKHIEVIPCPADDRHTGRDNWMTSPEGMKRARGEAMKLIRYVTNGVIPDFEMESPQPPKGTVHDLR